VSSEQETALPRHSAARPTGRLFHQCLLRLKERRFIRIVILIVNGYKPLHVRMCFQPSEHFLAPWLLWHVWYRVNEGNAPTFRTEQARGIVTLGQRQHDLCSGAFEQAHEALQQLLVYDLRQVAGVRSFTTVQDAINVKEDHLHWRLYRRLRTEMGA
jgi:hypothetical protein